MDRWRWCWSVMLASCLSGGGSAARAADAPTTQSMLAEQDAELTRSLISWVDDEFELRADMQLEPGLRAEVASLVREGTARLRTLVPEWIREERAATNDPSLRGGALARPLYARLLNELALSAVESEGPASDEAWLMAVQAPTACRFRHATFMADRVQMIQAAPNEARATLLASLKQSLLRWGTVRAGLPPRPSADELSAAEQEATRLRVGLPSTALPMTPYLAAQVFPRERKQGKPDAWTRCALNQWWLQSTLARPSADRAKALAVYRYAAMPQAQEYVPERLASKADSPSPPSPDGDPPRYPVAAKLYEVEGSTVLKVGIDAQGQVTRAEVVERSIVVPGVRNNRPVAFETVFDDAALEYAKRQRRAAGEPRETRIELNWKLEEADK